MTLLGIGARGRRKALGVALDLRGRGLWRRRGGGLAADVAVDGDDLYLLETGVGIVSHSFLPEPLPRC